MLDRSQFMVDEWASQCGFCTPGFIVSMTGYFLQAKTLDVDDALAFLGGNICRCTGYLSIKKAMTRLCELVDPDKFRKSYEKNRVNYLISEGFLPGYFESISVLMSHLPAEADPEPFQHGNVLLAGGTDLYIQKADMISTHEPYFILRNSHFRGIRQEGDQCVVGSATTVSEMQESDLFNRLVPEFKKYSRLISGASIRNRATIGGNIVNASPIGDLSILFLALNASLRLELDGRERMIQLKNFFLGYKKLDLYPGELVKELLIPMELTDHVIHFEKVSRRTHLDIASVNSAMSIRLNNRKIEEIHASAGGVGPVPMYLNGFCHHLQDHFFDEKLMETGIQIALNEINPISDVRGSKTYKCLLLEQQLRIHFSVLAAQINKIS
ncbi:MAG TPA: (2Fe-2S)-binding protein [Saprospirales bacterium]|nr:(2Fe-2S)-binding protein [Saprospirales bacterium]